MSTRRTSSVRVQRDAQGFTAVLASAVFEWLLIFLLFVDAFFSYLVTKFARFCKLQIPCILCSRLDNVLGNEKSGFYWDLICGTHKSEISSLILCHIHDKLVNVHGLCESCLFSFSTESKCNSETYRLLVGKLGTDVEYCVDQDGVLKDPMLVSSCEKHCSCCNEPRTLGLESHRLLHTKSTGDDITELDVPLSSLMGHSQLQSHNLLKTRSGKTSGVMTPSKVKNHGFDPLSHVGYTELKITSDSESEVPLSDDGERSALVRETDDLKEEFRTQFIQPEPLSSNPDILFNTLSDDLAPEKLINQTSMAEPSLLVQHETGKPYDLPSSSSIIAIGHGLEDLNWHQVEHKASTSTLSELNSVDDVPPSSNVIETLVETSGVNLDVVRTDDIGQTSITESGDICKLESELPTKIEPGLKADQALNDSGPPMPILMDLSDAYKLVVGNKGNQVSSMLAEQLTTKNSSKVSGDLMLLLSQISAARGLELSLTEMSPRLPGNGEGLKIYDASSSIGVQILHKKISLERNESGFESLDGSIVSEIEGESVVDRLKRQVEYDRKSMNALYKELEEERNASAIAANQAMAMITRLQEEKASLHMEALQYLRMMEEQEEYDVEALQKTNDCLAETEKKVQDLEAELEIYREKFPLESKEKVQDLACDLMGEDKRVDHSICIGNSADSPYNISSSKKSEISNEPEKSDMVNGDEHMSISKGSLEEFEDERLYISESLKKLEKKLHLFSNNGVHMDMPNGGDPQFVSKENHHFDCDGKDNSLISKVTDLVALENEVLDLNERLKALEADQNFLEHTINTLQNGDDGVQFIQEIVRHLRELRRIGISREQACL